MTDHRKIVCIYGPQGSGKTRYSKQFAKHYGCTRIVEMDDVSRPVPTSLFGRLVEPFRSGVSIREGDLLLTNETPRRNKGMRYIHIDQAKRDAGIGVA